MLNTNRFKTVLVSAILIAVLGARSYVGNWNDGSRLASVESLVDRHTWVIDDSIFVNGTKDKIFVRDHFYSDEPPVVVTLDLAGLYWIAQQLTGLTAAPNPHDFVYLLIVTSAGLGYVVGVLCIWFLALRRFFS